MIPSAESRQSIIVLQYALLDYQLPPINKSFREFMGI